MEERDFISLGDWRVVSTLAVVAIAALYYYLTSSFDYWKKRGFPELPVKPLPLFGHTFKMLTGQQNFADTFDDLYIAAGDKPYVGMFMGTTPCLLVKDPELIRHIYIKDFNTFMDRSFEIPEEADPLNAKGLSNLKGPKWKEMRARLSPTFTSGRMKAMFPIMLACSHELVECMTKDIENSGGETIIDMKEILMCFSTDVIATCAFGVECDALQSPTASKFRKIGKLMFQMNFKRVIVIALLLISPKLLKWLGLKFSEEESSTFFRSFVKEMVDQREKAIDLEDKGCGENSKRFGDFLYHLVSLKKRGLNIIDLMDGEDGMEIFEDKRGDYKAYVEPSWTNVSLDDLTAQAMQFFSAGFETTALTLSLALFELSSEDAKDIQRNLRDEIDRVMEEDGGKITYEGLMKMHLLDRVLTETLRLYPPAALLNRVALQPYTIPGTNLTIDKGIQVNVPTKSMQYDERFYANPRRFDPDRFLPENKKDMEPMSYVPFGVGPRICIGRRFALMVARLGLATLISKFELERCPEKTVTPLKFKKRAFLMTTDHGIWLKVKRRSK